MSLLFVSVLAASGAIDLAVVLAVLLVAPPAVGLGRVALAFVLVAAVALPKALVLGAAGAGAFGVLHLAWVDVFVVTPALGAVVLGLARRGALRPTPAVRALAWSALALVPIGVHASWIEPYRLQLERAELELPRARGGVEPVHVGILADLQTTRVTDYERAAVARLLAAAPDLVLIPGDLYQGPWELLPERAPAFRELLRALAAVPAGAYFVLGDCETRRGAEILLEGTGVRLLDDEIVEVSVRDRRLAIGGLQLAVHEPSARAVARALEERADAEDVRILLAHRPDAVYALGRGTRVDVVVAGHTHGGQVVLPGFGPPITLSDVPRSVAAGGLHALDGRAIYVSRGVGMERGHAPRLRFLCPPEVTLLTLYGE